MVGRLAVNALAAFVILFKHCDARQSQRLPPYDFSVPAELSFLQ
ncbi:MAG: hypothetical protein ACPL7D_09930 [Candidatus Sumerlaeaceae bacterium]|jgi:hypothetical protein